MQREVTSHPKLTDRIIRQGRALVRAIEGLATINPTGLIERFIAGRVGADSLVTPVVVEGMLRALGDFG